MRQIAHFPLGNHVQERGFFRMLRVAFVSFVMLLCSFPSLHAQFTNTHYDEENYIFYYENGSAGNPGKAQDAFVINSYGDVLQKWTGGNIIAPEGAPGYLLPTGLLLRGVEAIADSGEKFQVGAYGILQMVDKNGNVVWEYNGCSWPDGIPDTDNRPYCLQHDIEPLPNGNILASVHVVYTEADAEAELGFTPTGQGKVTMEEIWEIRPDLVSGGGEIVWKWKIVDHLVQDANTGLPNYGDVSNPGLFNINGVNSKSDTSPRQNGNHINMNGISYNPDRDQILFSSMKSSEVYIINHNLTTEEAATSAGDFMWRWGNPKSYAYGGGSSATYSSWKWTRGQHDPRWIVDGTGNFTGNITIHNNNSVTNPKPAGGQFEAWTEFFEVVLPYDGNGGYTRSNNQPYGPASPTILAEYNPDLPYLNDGFASGGQKLPNGHVFTGSATKFTLVEHDETGNIVWYFDCRDLTPVGGQMWKPFKYPVDYAGFIALGITNGTIYTVTFDLDGKGSRTGGGGLTQNVVQGSAAIEPTITANAGYTFTGWDVAFDTVTSGLNVTAQYSVNPTYTLTVNGGTGSGSYENGQEVAISATVLPNYHFVNWTGDTAPLTSANSASTTVTMPASAVTVTANTAINTYTVTFVEGPNGTRTGGGDLSQDVAHGSAAIEPTITANEGFTFTGWDVAFDTVTSVLNVTAQYITIIPSIILSVDAPTISENSGMATFTATLSEISALVVTVNLSFAGTASKDEGDYVASDSQIVIYAGSTSGSIVVTAIDDSMDEDDETVVVSIDSVTNATEDVEQEKQTQILDDDVIVTYTVTFVEGTNGSRTGGGLLVQTVNHGSAAVPPSILPNTGYTFTGWDAPFDNVTSDLTLTAQYSVIVNTPPVADDQSLVVTWGRDLVITMTASDLDGDTFTYALVSSPANGTLTGSVPNVTYVSNPEFKGLDSFTFKASDDHADSSIATVTINVTNVRPRGTTTTTAVTVNTAKDLTLTGVDDDGDTITFALASAPSNGVLNGTAPNLTYTPDADYTGSDSFTYLVNDGLDDSDPVTVDITVSAAGGGGGGGGGGCNMGSTTRGTSLPIVLMLFSVIAIRLYRKDSRPLSRTR